MRSDVIRRQIHSRHLIQGWTFSLLLHLGVVFTAVMMMPRMTVLVEQEPFKWDVSVVEPSPELRLPNSPSAVPAVRPAHNPETKPAPPVEASSSDDIVMSRVASQQSPQLVHPSIEPSRPQQPIGPVQDAPPMQEASHSPAETAESQEIKKLEVRDPEPVLKETAQQELGKDRHREAAFTTERAAPAQNNASPLATGHEPVSESGQETVSAADVPPVPVKKAEHKAVDDSALSAEADTPTQVAKAVSPPLQKSDAKADHRWLAELLWKRVAEFKQYPSSARLNGLEGKVVLKAVIRADGQLVEVTVQKSSGHAVLDAAAIETVKLATPLAMTQPLKRAEIVVSLPIVYSLAN